MTNNMPSISCIIPTYNYAGYIAQAVDSILEVLGDDDQVIVVDDGSTDNTHRVLQNYIAEKKILYHYQKNSGVSAARNTGSGYADRDYFYFLDSDDRVLKEGFFKLRRVVDESPGIAFAFGGHVSVIGPRRRIHRQKTISDNATDNFMDYVIRRRFSIANGGLLIRNDVAKKYAYPEQLKVSEDLCVYAWVMANEQVVSIPEPVVEIVKHEDSLRNQTEDYAEVIEQLPDIVFDANRLPLPLMAYKKRFYCNRLLSLFRTQYLAGEYESAKKTYTRALSCRPSNVLKGSYLRKYLKAVFR